LNALQAEVSCNAPLTTPTDLEPDGERDLGARNTLLADMFGLYFKTKNFHSQILGTRFPDYHLLLDAQGDSLMAATDAIAERVRKIGGTALRSVRHIGRLQRIRDNNAGYVGPVDTPAKLGADSKQLAAWMCGTDD
jgi:starvation-inducible DNA-binding protein